MKPRRKDPVNPERFREKETNKHFDFSLSDLPISPRR